MYIKTVLKSLLTLEPQRKDTGYNNSIYIVRYKLHNVLYMMMPTSHLWWYFYSIHTHMHLDG